MSPQELELLTTQAVKLASMSVKTTIGNCNGEIVGPLASAIFLAATKSNSVAGALSDWKIRSSTAIESD